MAPSIEANLIACIRRLSHPLEPIPTSVEAVLEPLQDIRAVLFDVYGTLITSGSGDVGTAMAADSTSALAEALSEAGFVCASDEAIEHGVQLYFDSIQRNHEQRHEQGTAFPEVDIRTIWYEVLTTLAGAGAIRGEVSPDSVLRLAVEYECRVNPVWPMPSAEQVLQHLGRKGVRLGIVSNAQFFTPLALTALFGGPPDVIDFDPAICIWSYELLEAKPSPSLFHAALDTLEQRHDISSAQTLYVGNDVRNDIGPAHTCGCRTALFAGDLRSLRLREDEVACSDIAADVVLTELVQLKKVVP